MNTETESPSIIVVPEGSSIKGTNRFLAPKIMVDWNVSHEQLLKEADCQTSEVVHDSFFPYPFQQSEHGFEVVRFDTWGVTPEMVAKKFDDVGMYAADFHQLMTFAKHHRLMLKGAALLAIGRNNKWFLKKQEDRFNFVRKWWRNRRGAWQKQIAYPCLEYFGEERPGRLRLSKGEGGWKPVNLFLGAYRNDLDHPSWCMLPISRAKYKSLIYQDEMKEGDLEHALPLGTLFKATDGHVCEIIQGKDTPQGQWGNLMSDPPERYWAHYLPVITD